MSASLRFRFRGAVREPLLHGRHLSHKNEGFKSATVWDCHFFVESEIEFDFDPRQVTGQDRLNAVFSFMQLIARACDKKAVLTPENARDATIFRVHPPTLHVEYVRRARPVGSGS